MTDRPDAATLLRAMAATLSEVVMPATSGGAQHATRVVANLCRILEREWIAGNDGEARTLTALNELTGKRGDCGDEATKRLDERLRSSDAAFDEEARRVLLADVRRRLSINRPGYDS